MRNLEIVQFEVGLLQNFCEIIACPRTGKAALVDPAFEVDRLLAHAKKKSWEVESILLTHTHEDHIAGLDEAASLTGATVYCHPLEVPIVEKLAERVAAVKDQEAIPIGEGQMRAIYAPGHTAGCICWYGPESDALITGDVLFVGSCGGVQYPTSDVRAMLHTLNQRIGGLPEQTRIYPGHDYGETPTSRLAWELEHNPALLHSGDLAAFCAYKGIACPPD